MGRRITKLKKSQTDGKASKGALSESEAKYQQLFATVSDAIMLFDAETKQFVDVNDAALDLYGYSKEEFLELRHPDITSEPEESEASIEQALSGKLDRIPVRYHKKKDGTIFPVEISASTFTLRDRKVLCGVIRDITERKRVEEALKESQKKYSTLVENSLTGIYIDQNGKIVFANRKFAEIYRHPRDELIGMESWKLVHPEDRALTNEIRTNRLKGEEAPSEYEARGLTRDGETIWIARRNTRIDYKGRPAILGNIEDITKRKRAEDALEHMNKKLLMEHKQRKLLSKRLITLLENDRRQLAMELHDHVGQMLTALKMDLEVVLGEVKPDGAAFKESTQLAHDKALQAMEEIRNIARGLRPTTLDTLGLASSLRELFDDIKEHTDLEIHFFHKRLPRRLDPEKELAIYRIVQEALTNVVKHAHAEKVFVNLVREKKFITLGVEDAGVGFDKDKVMKISRVKGPLGLLIMQERAVQVDGEFSIESRIGGGTHLLARIPV